MTFYKKYTHAQKVQYAKKFTKKERSSYNAGKRYGFLCGVHAPKRK